MARLVAVCRDGEEEFPFERRQIPLYIDDTLTDTLFLPQHEPRNGVEESWAFRAYPLQKPPTLGEA